MTGVNTLRNTHLTHHVHREIDDIDTHIGIVHILLDLSLDFIGNLVQCLPFHHHASQHRQHDAAITIDNVGLAAGLRGLTQITARGRILHGQVIGCCRLGDRRCNGNYQLVIGLDANGIITLGIR